MDSGRPWACAWEEGSARSGPTGVRGLNILFNEGITKYAALAAFLPNLTWFPSPRGQPGSTVQPLSSAWLNDRAPEGSSPLRAPGPESLSVTVTASRPCSAAPAAAAPATTAGRSAAARVAGRSAAARVAGGGAAGRPAAATVAPCPPATAARRRTAPGGPPPGTRRVRSLPDPGHPRQDRHQHEENPHTDQHRDEDRHAPHPPFSPPKRGSPVASRFPLSALFPSRFLRDRGIPTARAGQSRLEQLQSLGTGWRP